MEPLVMCLCVPIKFGVAVVAMLTFAHSLVCILALLTVDIRFMPNGYDPHVLLLPSIVGSGGVIIGLVGLLGVYDGKPSWIRALLMFLRVKVAAMLVSIVADYRMLWRCEGWNRTGENLAMDVLAEAGVCHWARWAYLLGGSIDLGVWGYFVYKVWLYCQDCEQRPHAIDFGAKQGVEGLWQTFRVRDPRPDAAHASALRRQYVDAKAKADSERNALDVVQASYGSFAEQQSPTVYGPDGMPVDAPSWTSAAEGAAAAGPAAEGPPRSFVPPP